MNLGVVLVREGKLAEAAAQHERALRIKPDYAEAHTNLGLVLFMQGDLAQAAAQFETALRIKPNYAYARQHLERVRARLGTDQ